MSSEEENNSAEDALARSDLHLSTLYELNQELSTLRNVSEVLESSLLNIIGVFGLRRGLIALYKGDETQPREFASRGMQKRTAQNWFQQLEEHLKAPYIREECFVQDSTDSPLAKLLKNQGFSIWLPLQVDDETWGGIALGVKLLEMEFTEDERELLSTIAINVQNVLSNVTLIEALHQAVTKETRIRNVFQRYAPESVINQVLDPSNEELLLGESQEVRRMFDQIITDLEEQHTLEKELERAYEVQQYLLPDKRPQIAGIDIVARSIPARSLGGDFYDFIPLGPHEVGISLADISGKGTSAAMIAAMLQAATRMCVGSYYPIPATLSILNRFVYQHTDMARYATMFYGQVNSQNRTLTYSNAGHPPALLCRDGELQMLESGGPMVGLLEDCSYDQAMVVLKPSDALIIYSDGVTDAGITPESETFDDAFGQERLESTFIANATLSADALLDTIFNEVTQHAAGSEQFDDITLIVIKVE